MAVEVVMPKWGMSMQEGHIGQWLKQEGEEVDEGEELVEVETEKITNVVESPAAGILARILYPTGVDVPVTQVIAIITKPGEAIPEIIKPGAAAPEVAAPPQPATPVAVPVATAPIGEIRAMPVARKMAKEHGLDLAAIQGTGRGGIITKADVEKAIAAPSQPAEEKPVRVMPVARRMAKDHGLDLAKIKGTGSNGTVTKEDVQRALAEKEAPSIRPIRKVSFFSEGHRLDGLLFSPDDVKPGEQRPGVVLCVGYTYLKTMVMPDIAKILNKLGYVALTFDYRGFGDSDGSRWRLMPNEQVNDARAALTFLADQPHVDPERLAVMGISLGGSHALTVGAVDPRIRAVVAIEPMGNGRRWLRSLRRYSEWMDFEARLAVDRLQRVKTGVSEAVDPLEIVVPDSASKAFLDAVANEFPQMNCQVPLETADALLEYSPESLVHQIAPRPLLLIHGQRDQMIPVDESISLAQLAGESAQLELIPDMEHFNWVMPDSPGFKQVSDLIVEFVQEHLSTP